MDTKKAPLLEGLHQLQQGIHRIEQWLQEEQERQDKERGKSAERQNTSRALAVASLIAAIVGLLSFFLPPRLDLAGIPTAPKSGDISMALRGMVICFSSAILLMAGHAWVHYVAVEEELEQLNVKEKLKQSDQSEVLEAIIKESEVGSRAKGFINYTGMLRNFSIAFALLGFGLAARTLLRILLGY